MLHNKPIIVYGDGTQTRDFVYVDDVVQANINAANSIGVSDAFNIASGNRISINDLIKLIVKNYDKPVDIQYTSKRAGDVMHSLADITFAKDKINYSPSVDLDKGIEEYIKWAKKFYLK